MEAYPRMETLPKRIMGSLTVRHELRMISYVSEDLALQELQCGWPLRGDDADGHNGMGSVGAESIEVATSLNLKITVSLSYGTV